MTSFKNLFLMAILGLFFAGVFASSWLGFGRLSVRELLTTTGPITKFNSKWLSYRITTAMISSPADDNALKTNLSVSSYNNCFMDDFTLSEFDTNVRNNITNPLLRVMTDGKFYIVCPKF